MAVGPFLSHDTGFADLLGAVAWASTGYYAVLSTTGTSPDRASHATFNDIPNKLSVAGDYSHQALGSKTATVESTKVRFTCGKITFTSEGSITARYLHICKGTAASPQSADPVLGSIDLTGDGNASSVNAEFSFTPHANGLFEIERTTAA
jgi:hypothetical protein